MTRRARRPGRDGGPKERKSELMPWTRKKSIITAGADLEAYSGK